MANKRVKKITNKNYLLLLLLFFATISMGIGYASVFGVLSSIDGTAVAITQDVIHISVTNYSSDNGADVSNSMINDYYATTMNSTITLGNNAQSTITYSITITNDTNDNYMFTGTSYDAPDFYDNPNITYDLNGINVGDTINGKQSKTFTITFRYVSQNITNTRLNSYISFDFEKYHTITYQNINNSSNYSNYILESETTKTITFTGDVPYDVTISPQVNYTYTYNTTSGTLVLNNVVEDITINRYYKITYNTQGTNHPNQPTKYLPGETVVFLNPTNGTQTFLGWYLNSSYTGNAVINTSGLSGDLELFGKWSSGTYETATTFITNLVGNASDTSTNIITLTAPTGESCTNTLAYDGTSDKNLRYVGADPCNYVKFNCDSNNNCEIWRIIGVLNNVGNDPVLKLVKNDNTLTIVWNTTKNNNTWANASSNTTLNSTYLNSFNTGVINNYVLNAEWNIGAVAYNGVVSNIYTSEKGTKSSAAYIGLISPSDYYYATSGTSDSTRTTCLNAAVNGNSISATCYNNDYLFIKNNNNQGLNQWTINKATQGNNVFYISNVGRGVRGTVTSEYSYRPAIHLKSTVKINTSSGNGSINSPYELYVD